MIARRKGRRAGVTVSMTSYDRTERKIARTRVRCPINLLETFREAAGGGGGGMGNGFERWRIRWRNEYRHKGQLKSQSSGPNYVEKRGARAGRARPPPIYNKMKAIRGDNPRTTNQRVYLMPVVPPSPPDNLPTLEMQRVRTLSFSPVCPSSLCTILSPFRSHSLACLARCRADSPVPVPLLPPPPPLAVSFFSVTR